MTKRSFPLTWLLGAALLAVVVGAALHVSDSREFVVLAERAGPWWLALAVTLQLGTYVAQGNIWRRVAAAARAPLPPGDAFVLSLAKLFADQALPSAGISGSLLVARALRERGIRDEAVNAAVLINVASYHLAYVIALGLALTILIVGHRANALIISTSVLFVVFAIVVTAAVTLLAGRPDSRVSHLLQTVTPLRGLLQFMGRADATLARSVALLRAATQQQLAIVACDAATMWVLLRSIGVTTQIDAVFASFMISSLVRTLGVVPGGLGTFEATSVLTLTLTGATVAQALSATLLFRALSFWIPMIPGLWASRRILGSGEPPSVDRGEYWSRPATDLLRDLSTTNEGLTQVDAAERRRRYGPNALRVHQSLSRMRLLANQLRNPLLLLLVFAAVASAVTREWVDSAIVLTVVFATVAIGYSREYGAQAAIESLRARIRTRAKVLRDGNPQSVPVEDIVPGDVVLLSAGSLVPADAVVLESTDCYVGEAALTGESFPVQKAPGVAALHAPLRDRDNCVFLGTNVRSGTARCLVVRTGSSTELGAIARRLTAHPPDTEFDRGIRHFGYLVTTAMLILVLVLFAAHVFLGRAPLETLLFSVALAVGLSPELLPAILSLNLARGASMMARDGVLVRRLNAIENLGSMDILFTDKTGTLTEGIVKVAGAYDAAGVPSPHVLDLAATNAALETGLANPLDTALLGATSADVSGLKKLAEIPFDFTRKRLTVVVARGVDAGLITKGAFDHVLEACTTLPDGTPLDVGARQMLTARCDRWCADGIRVIAVATRRACPRADYSRDDEREMVFEGFVTFLDMPKEGVREAITGLAVLGVSVKVITGDSRLVARHVAGLVGLRSDRLLDGRELDALHGAALWHAVENTDLFVEVDPDQKERIILAAKKMGHVVGFLGDGVNDAPAMHAADTSLSVDQAVDVAKEAADFVLLERGLDVIRRGIEEGRRTFANTLKYILTTTSANLGNMLSMAGASLFLPFLPLLPGQILLNNFLSDIPAVGIADDRVDHELVERPRRWNVRFIGRFMLVFGVVSSVFDLLTFGALRLYFDAAPDLFRTTWFVESLLTELLVALVVRTRRPFFRSRPGALLLWSTIMLVPLTLAIPYLPYANLFGFVKMPGAVLGVVVVISVLYVAATELVKRPFFTSAERPGQAAAAG
jgi:Mg2+-importing ATPase